MIGHRHGQKDHAQGHGALRDPQRCRVLPLAHVAEHPREAHAADRVPGEIPAKGRSEGEDGELDPTTGRLRYIEVKGRAEGATTITVTRNEILCSLNVPEQWYLAIVEVRDGQAAAPVYLRAPFRREPDFGATSVTYSIRDLTAGASSGRT